MHNLRKPDFYQRIIDIDMPASASFIYNHAGTMNQRCTNDNLFANFCAYNSEVVADDVIVVGDHSSSRYVLVGALTAKRSLTHLSVVWRGRKMREIKIWQPEIKEGDEPEEILILEGGDWRELLVQYGKRAAAAMGGLLGRGCGDTVTGYCSWYYYYKDVTQKDFLDNVEILAEKQNSPFKAKYVQIDDGYQLYQGDWLRPHPSWPTPLDEIAKKISDGGMQAGIWTMPFHASTASDVFKNHPDWFVKGPDGNPLVAQGWSPPPDHLWATLDTTQPAVLEHLANIFRTFRKWGYTYFKMDGLGFALVDGHRADPSATTVSAFRQGLKAIREAVPDSFLLACSQHFLPCVGLVDGARFSEDTHASTGPIFRAANQTLSRFWMFDRFYRADPDCLIVRTDRGSQTEGESRISALTGILTGFALTSDNLSLVPEDRLELLGRASTIRMQGVMPAERAFGFPDQIPATFSGTVDGARALAFINYTDSPRTWEAGKTAGFERGRIYDEILAPMGTIEGSITLGPHDAALIRERV